MGYCILVFNILRKVFSFFLRKNCPAFRSSNPISVSLLSYHFSSAPSDHHVETYIPGASMKLTPLLITFITLDPQKLQSSTCHQSQIQTILHSILSSLEYKINALTLLHSKLFVLTVKMALSCVTLCKVVRRGSIS